MDINVQSRGGSRGCTYFDRPISKKVFDNAKANGGRVTKDDEKRILTDAERLGYGASASGVFEQDGMFFAHCHRYNNCD